jgi:LPXTG-site transpeptidase (sortase) family protein
MLAFSAYNYWQRYRATHSPHPLPAANQVVDRVVAKPDETPIQKTAQYEVPADQPRKISLPTIGAEAFIQKVGVDQTKAMAAPSNVHMAGWYSPEVRPGDEGLSIIDGHVQGRYEAGVFKNLASLKTGDEFEVEYGDHSIRRFVTRSVKAYSVDDASKALFERQSYKAQLNLITCGGAYDAAAHQYKQRTIVVSELQK